MSENGSIAHRYREVAVRTANPLQLVVMLYDAALCSIREAQQQIDRKDIAGRSRSLNRVIAVISELQSSLDRKAGGPIAGSLDRLYDYIKRSVFKAGVNQSKEQLAEVGALLENLRSAWAQLANEQPAAVMPAREQPPEAPFTPPMQLKSLNVSI